jgi:predicted dehydrogenase
VTPPFRWGLLGTARINRAVIPPMRASDRHQLAAVASRTAERAAEYAREWSIPVAFGTYDELLASPDIDAVYIALPNALHAEWTVRAARAGKHVLCEKPLAISVAEVDAIAEAAASAGVAVAEAFMYRHHPQTLQLKALVDEGAIGSLQVIRSAFSFSLDRPRDVRFDPALGGGSLWDVGCYPVSMARYLVGAEPVSVMGWQRLTPGGIDELFAGSLDFGPSLAQFDCSFRSPFRTHLEIVGSDASITVPVPFKPGTAEQLLVNRAGVIESVPSAGQALYIGELDDLADAAQLGRPSRVSLSDSRSNVAAIVALYEAARRGKPVTI